MASRLMSRAEIGLRPWVCFPTNMRVEGLTLHYPGPSPWNTSRSVNGAGIDRSSPQRFRDTCDHRFCAAIWRGYQAYHMDARGGCDIFYDGGTCPHGVRLSGRPRNMRSGAQGTNDGNLRSKGIQYIGGLASNGQLDPLTDEAKSAYHDWAADLGWPLRWGHRDWKSTSCPGGDVYAWKQAGFPRPSAPPPPPPPAPPPVLVKDDRMQLIRNTSNPTIYLLYDGNLFFVPSNADRKAWLDGGVKESVISPEQLAILKAANPVVSAPPS